MKLPADFHWTTWRETSEDMTSTFQLFNVVFQLQRLCRYCRIVILLKIMKWKECGEKLLHYSKAQSLYLSELLRETENNSG